MRYSLIIFFFVASCQPAPAQSVNFNVTPNLEAPGDANLYTSYGDENIYGTLTLANGTLTATVIGSSVRGLANDRNEGAYHFIIIDSNGNATGNNDRIWNPKTTTLYLSTQTVDASQWTPPFFFIVGLNSQYYGQTYGPSSANSPDWALTLAAITPAPTGGTSLWVVGLAGFAFGWMLLSPLARK
jgi:hypothetical protein